MMTADISPRDCSQSLQVNAQVVERVGDSNKKSNSVDSQQQWHSRGGAEHSLTAEMSTLKREFCDTFSKEWACHMGLQQNRKVIVCLCTIMEMYSLKKYY